MLLNQKVALIVVLVFALSGAVSLALQQGLIMPSFVSLERDTAEENIQRALQGIGRELKLIGPSASESRGRSRYILFSQIGTSSSTVAHW